LAIAEHDGSFFVNEFQRMIMNSMFAILIVSFGHKLLVYLSSLWHLFFVSANEFFSEKGYYFLNKKKFITLSRDDYLNKIHTLKSRNSLMEKFE